MTQTKDDAAVAAALSDDCGSGRIIQSVFVTPTDALKILQSIVAEQNTMGDIIPNPPLFDIGPCPQRAITNATKPSVIIGRAHRNSTTNSKYKSYGKKVTMYFISTEMHGLVLLCVKRVLRTSRPKDEYMDVNQFLQRWPTTCKLDFMASNMLDMKVDQLQQRYRYVIPGALPWSLVQPSKNEAGLSINSVAFVCESTNAQMLSSLFTRSINPHFLAYYQGWDETRKQLSYIIVQQCDITLATEISRMKSQTEHCFMQVLFALRAMQSHFQMMHNDLFAYSIILQRIRHHTKWKGQPLSTVNYWSYPCGSTDATDANNASNTSKRLYIRAGRTLVKISDMGFSSSFVVPGGSVRRDIWEDTHNDIGMPRTYQPQCDVMLLLNDLYTNYCSPFVERCLGFIQRHFEYASLDAMFTDILIPGQRFRIKSNKLPELTAALLIDNAHEYCSDGFLISDAEIATRIDNGGVVLNME